MMDALFDNVPKVKRKLNILPDNPDKEIQSEVVEIGRFPRWLHRKLPKGGALWKTHGVLDKHRLPTVCEEAKCPNLLECYSQKTATFLALGKECTRSCGFCSIDFNAKPNALETDEPTRLAESVKALGLKHVVITMVARDDLTDGGASQLVLIIQEIRKKNQGVTIEVLTSDFEGNLDSLNILLSASPEIFNHNIETVKALSSRVRHKATYERTLAVLKHVSSSSKNIYVKSGLMVGLGESIDQVHETLMDLKVAGCMIVTIGQYLQSHPNKLRVKSFVSPEQFKAFADYGMSIGIPHVYASPFVRSSYNAATLFNSIAR